MMGRRLPQLRILAALILLSSYHLSCTSCSSLRRSKTSLLILNATKQLLPDQLQAAPGAGCSRRCESKDCLFPPLLRYGKYCGIGYTGCPGEKPCDALDACCQDHDACIGTDPSNYLNATCNRKLLECVLAFEVSGAPQFRGATCSRLTVCTSMEISMAIALRIHHNNGTSDNSTTNSKSGLPTASSSESSATTSGAAMPRP